MKKLYRIFILVAIGLVCSGLSSLRAQTNFDIGLFEYDPTTLEVRLRCDQTTVGLVSNVQFTIRWDQTTGTSLGAGLSFPFPLVITPKAGIEVDNSGFRYQKFAGFNNSPSNWTSGTEIVILRIPVVSTTNPSNPLPGNGFTISLDGFTLGSNGEFYVEFNSLNRTGIIYNASPVFPIELMSFDAEKVSDHIVMVDWATSSEINNDHFLVEKSRTGGTFQEIGKVLSQGDSDEIQTYSFQDATEMAPVNYYRLKQVDTDGTFTYSDVVEVLFVREESKQFTVYPSPAKDRAFLKSANPLDGDYAYYVSDLVGKVVMKGVIQEDSPTLSATLDVRNLPSGTYVIRTESPLGKVFVNRLVKE